MMSDTDIFNKISGANSVFAIGTTLRSQRVKRVLNLNCSSSEVIGRSLTDPGVNPMQRFTKRMSREEIKAQFKILFERIESQKNK